MGWSGRPSFHPEQPRRGCPHHAQSGLLGPPAVGTTPSASSKADPTSQRPERRAAGSKGVSPRNLKAQLFNGARMTIESPHHRRCSRPGSPLSRCTRPSSSPATRVAPHPALPTTTPVHLARHAETRRRMLRSISCTRPPSTDASSSVPNPGTPGCSYQSLTAAEPRLRSLVERRFTHSTAQDQIWNQKPARGSVCGDASIGARDASLPVQSQT